MQYTSHCGIFESYCQVFFHFRDFWQKIQPIWMLFLSNLLSLKHEIINRMPRFKPEKFPKNIHRDKLFSENFQTHKTKKTEAVKRYRGLFEWKMEELRNKFRFSVSKILYFVKKIKQSNHRKGIE